MHDLEISQGVNIPEKGKLLRETVRSANPTQVHLKNVAEDAPDARYCVESDTLSPEAGLPQLRVIQWLTSSEEIIQVPLFPLAKLVNRGRVHVDGDDFGMHRRRAQGRNRLK